MTTTDYLNEYQKEWNEKFSKMTSNELEGHINHLDSLVKLSILRNENLVDPTLLILAKQYM